MCKVVRSCDLLVNTPPMNDQKTLQALGVTKLTVIFDENGHEIAIFGVCAPKRHTFAVTSLIESPTKAEARKRNIRYNRILFGASENVRFSVKSYR